MNYNPKNYKCNYKILLRGKNLTKEQKLALRNGEILILLSKYYIPHRYILMDSYDTIREAKINYPFILIIRIIWNRINKLINIY